MITEAFDDKSKAIINPKINENAPAVDACILTFSEKIERFVTENYDCKQIGTFRFATGDTPVYQIDFKGKKFAFYKTYVGAPACTGTIEDSLSVIKTKKICCIRRRGLSGQGNCPRKSNGTYRSLSGRGHVLSLYARL